MVGFTQYKKRAPVRMFSFWLEWPCRGTALAEALLAVAATYLSVFGHQRYDQ